MGHTAPLILLSSKGAGPESRSVAGHVTTALRLAPRDALQSAVGGGGAMGDDNEQGEPTRSAIKPTRKSAPPPALPPSLSRLPTELDRLYLELGGPAPLRPDIDRKAFEIASKEFSWVEVEPSLRRFQKDRDVARRHWPWVAFALDTYRFERRERQREGAKLTPGEVKELLNEIRRSARELVGSLGRLQEYANSLGDPVAPFRQPHLAYLDEFISQAAAGRISGEVNQDLGQMLHVFLAKQSFMKRLVDIEVAAGEAVNRMDSNLLKRKKGQGDTGLHNLVWRCAEIWESMTSRKASAHKVHTVHGDDPDFVKFVQALVGLVGAPQPSRKQIEISLKNAPPMATRKSERSGV
jgi:hypothetical protein